MTKADTALLVTNNNQGCKTESAATLDHFCHTVDVYKLIDEFAVALFTISASHVHSFQFYGTLSQLVSTRLQTNLEFQAAFAGSITKRLDTAMIDKAATVKHDLLDASVNRTFRNQLANGRSCVPVSACFQI